MSDEDRYFPTSDPEAHQREQKAPARARREQREQMSERERLAEDRRLYKREEHQSALRAEGWIGSLWEDHALIARYGSREELNDRAFRATKDLDWWARRGPWVQPTDKRVIEALELVRERLIELPVAAEDVEDRLRRRGWEYDKKGGTVEELKETGPNGQKKRGRQKGEPHKPLPRVAPFRSYPACRSSPPQWTAISGSGLSTCAPCFPGCPLRR